MSAQPMPLINKYRFGWVLFWLLNILLVNATAIGLAESIRGLDATWMIPFGILAISLGWVVGGAQKRGKALFIVGMLAGSAGLLLILSGTFTTLGQAILLALRRAYPHLTRNYSSAELDTLIYNLYAIASKFSSFYSTVSNWLTSFIQGQSGFNPLLRDLIWGSLFWAVLFSAGWMFRRKAHAFIASLPTLILLSAVLGYSRQNTLGLIIALGAILMLMGLQAQLIREDRWQQQSFDYSEEIRFDITVITIPVVLLILIFAGVIPNISIKDIRDFFNERITNETSQTINFPDSLGLEQNPIEPFDNVSESGMPRSHLIGSGPELSDMHVMNISTGEVFLPPQVSSSTPLPKYYWRGRTYDFYTGTGWETSPIISETVPAGEPIIADNEEYETVITQKIRKSANTSDTLFAAGQPLLVDQRITAGWRQSTGEYFSAYLPAHIFTVTSQIHNLTENTLKTADEEVPPEILEAYLQIPAEIPERVKELAASLTEEATTPYLKSKAIETYLRNFEYTLDLPPLPANQDVVDYFLFELQKGYCDYYASAMVLLARASGLPSRIAVGYGTGNYDYVEQEFAVTEANAHAWPEVYIAPFGWIPFEPTASLSTFAWQPETDQMRFLPTTSIDPTTENPITSTWLNLLGVIILICITLMVGFMWYWINQQKKKSTSTTIQIEKIYRRMETLLTNRFFTPQKALTPLEFRNDMIDYLNNHTKSKISIQLIQDMSQELTSLTTLYHTGVYTSQTLPSEQIKNAREYFRAIQTKSWILNLLFLINFSSN